MIKNPIERIVISIEKPPSKFPLETTLRTRTEAKKETKVIDMDPVLTKDEAYNELYLQLRMESENKIKELDIKDGQRLTANGKAILMIPFLDEIGLDSLEKISEEASKMANKTSNQYGENCLS